MLAAPSVTLGVIRSMRFDTILVLGCALVALASGFYATNYPWLFKWILFADVWLLGTQHVVATYTRLCCDKASFLQNRFLVLGLPWLVILGVALAIYVSHGTLVITTLYLYWQWFHYTRQSYGVHRIYARKSPAAAPWDDKLTAFTMYAVPLWGILYRSYIKGLEPAQRFLGSDYWALPTPYWALALSGCVALALTTAWTIRQVSLYMDGKLSVAHLAYVVSHITVFVTGYYLIRDITFGWLVLNVWHNAQYILIVWMYNNNRFKRGIDPNARVLSFISQRKFFWLYFGVCIVVAVAFYSLLDAFNAFLLHFFMPAVGATWAVMNYQSWAMITYQAVNFHHYIVDGVIWKVRKQENQQRLGLLPTPTAAPTPEPAGFNRNIDADLEAVV